MPDLPIPRSALPRITIGILALRFLKPPCARQSPTFRTQTDSQRFFLRALFALRRMRRQESRISFTYGSSYPPGRSCRGEGNREESGRIAFEMRRRETVAG